MTDTGTGSLFNELYGNMAGLDPVVGMGATRLQWTDRTAGTIIAVLPAKHGQLATVVFQEDKATRIDANGMSDSQAYSYAPWEEGPVTKYTLRKDGSWVRLGDRLKNGERLLVGARKHYHDFSF